MLENFDQSETQSFFYLSNSKKWLHCTAAISAKVFYKNYLIDLLTGKESSSTPAKLHKLLSEISIDKKNNINSITVIHLSFEWGAFYHHLPISSEVPLALIFEYERHQIIDLSTTLENLRVPTWSEMQGDIFIDYGKQFAQVMEHLLAGDCYQLNLTQKFSWQLSARYHPLDFLFMLSSNKEFAPSPYAHYTMCPAWQFELLSNSPEGLFSILPGHDKIIAMPIKGSVKLNPEDNVKKKFQQMRDNPKEVGELDIITDLIRNDVAKLCGISYCRKRAKALKVPGILHQYSLVEGKLKTPTNLGQVLTSLFPGGSITGAPKKRVIDLTQKIEPVPRGFYCGSTILKWGNQCRASINIRTAEIYQRKFLSYGAGGGITLMSEVKNEWDELMLKRYSFYRLFQNDVRN